MSIVKAPDKAFSVDILKVIAYTEEEAKSLWVNTPRNWDFYIKNENELRYRNWEYD